MSADNAIGDTILSLSARLVQALRQLEREMPVAVREQTRIHIADAMGIAIAARRTDLARMVVDGQLSGCGSGTSNLIGGGYASPMAAAFINSALIHILDFDDIYDMGRLHPGTVVIPAVMAAAHLSGASNAEIIEATALGFELICRLGIVCSPDGAGPGSDWFLTQLLGYIAASYAAGKALHLSDDQLVSSIGLGYMQAAGGKQAGFGVGSNSRAIYPAFAAQGGLQAALLARAGMLGPAQALDGAANLFKIYLGVGLNAEQVKTLLDLSSWKMSEVEIKPWPCCRLSHPYIAASLSARQACANHPGASIRVAVNASASRLCHPLAERRRPITMQDAKYSIPFMTAYALVHGEPTLSALDENVLCDQAVLEMAARIEVDESLPDKPGHPPAEIVLFEGGEMIVRHRFNPDRCLMDRSRVREKFISCFDHAGIHQNAEPAWESLMKGELSQAVSQSIVTDQGNTIKVETGV